MKKVQNSKKEPPEYTSRQIDFALRYYLPNSPTYGNATQSALKAGYAEKTARNIIHSNEWVKDILNDIIGKKEQFTKEELVYLSRKTIFEILSGDDLKLKQDTAKFVLKTVAEFSEKTDITSGGEALSVALVEFVDGENGKGNS